MEKLKPCPFCGGKNIRVWNTSTHWVSCDDCLASTACALTEEEAVRYWNRRAKVEQSVGVSEKVEQLVEV